MKKIITIAMVLLIAGWAWADDPLAPNGSGITDALVPDDITYASTSAGSTTSTFSIGADPADAGDLRLPNAAVIGFEDGTEGTITHIDDTGLRVPDDFEWQFGSSGDARMKWNNSNSTFDFLQSDGTWKFRFDFANTAFLVAATAAPESGWYDNGAPGSTRSDQYVGSWGANYTDGAEDSENSDLLGYAQIGGAKSLVAEFDGSDEAWVLGDSATGEDLKLDFETATDNEVSISSNSGVTDLNFNALNMATTGTILGAVNIVTTTDGSESPTAAQMYGSFFVADNATAANDTDYTLPTATAGMCACFYDNGAGTGGIIIDAAAGDEILLEGSGIGAAEAIDSPGVAGDGANGDFICILAIDDTYWATLGSSGTWVDGGAD